MNCLQEIFNLWKYFSCSVKFGQHRRLIDIFTTLTRSTTARNWWVRQWDISFLTNTFLLLTFLSATNLSSNYFNDGKLLPVTFWKYNMCFCISTQTRTCRRLRILLRRSQSWGPGSDQRILSDEDSPESEDRAPQARPWAGGPSADPVQSLHTLRLLVWRIKTSTSVRQSELYW